MDDEDSEQFQSADEGADLVEECGATYPSSGVIDHGEKPRRKSPYSENTEITQPTSSLKLNSEYSLTPVIKDVARREPESKTLPPKVENKEKRILKDDGSAGNSVFDTLESKPIPSVKTPPVTSSGDLISERVESKSLPPKVGKKDKRTRKNRSRVGKFESDAVESEPTLKVEAFSVTSVADHLVIRDPHSESISPRVEKKDGTRQKDRIGVRQSESDAVESISIANVKSPTGSPASSDLMSKEQMSKASPVGVENGKEGLKVDSGITEFEPVDMCRMELPDAFQREQSVATHELHFESPNVLKALSVNQSQKQKSESPTHPSVTSDSVAVKSNGKGPYYQQHNDSVETCSVPVSLSRTSAQQEQELADSVTKKALLDHSIEELAIAEQNESFGTREAEQAAPTLNQTNDSRTEVSSHAVDLCASAESPGHFRHAVDVGDETVWNPELLSTTATHLVRGVGDGLNILADAFAQVVNFGVTNNGEDPELFDRRRRRALEEKAERETLTEAWSNVWNTAWGANDEWDVEEVSIPESNVDSHKSRTIPAENTAETVGFTPPSPRPQPPDPARSQSSAFWDWSGVSSLAQQLTSSFQTKGLNLVHEGVNVLEKIGKKTMSVIEENDPGFQYTKTLFRPPGLQERPNLSEIIREAHERHQNERNSETPSNESNRGSFTAQLESRRALVHLEALELVSDKAQSQLHIQLDTFLNASVVHEELNLDSGILEAIWKTLQLDIDDDENVNAGFPDQSTWKILKCKKRQPGSYGAYPTDLSEENSSLWVAFERSLSLIKTIYPGEKLLHSVINVWNEMKKVEASISAEEIYFIAIGALAEVTSAYLEYLHKFSECTLVRTHKPTADFERLTSIVAVMFRAAMKLIDALCSEYTGIIKSAHKIEGDGKPVKSVSQLAGSLLLECGNAQAYLQNTAHLLVPILQLACVNTKRAAGETE